MAGLNRRPCDKAYKSYTANPIMGQKQAAPRWASVIQVLLRAGRMTIQSIITIKADSGARGEAVENMWSNRHDQVDTPPGHQRNPDRGVLPPQGTPCPISGTAQHRSR